MRGSAICITGRLERLPRRRLVREIERHGGRLARRLSKRTAMLALGHGARHGIADGTLAALLNRADELGVPVVSEHALLRRIGLLAPAPAEKRFLDRETLARQGGVTPAVLRMLSLFDLLDADGETYGFRDLRAARQVAMLIRGGAELQAVVEAGLAARRASGFRAHLSEIAFGVTPEGGICKLADGRPVDPDGQGRLPLDAPPRSCDDLFDAAESAEQEGDLALAERLYRRCLSIRRDDPIGLYNLGNVLAETGQEAEARLLLRYALALDPGFADAWFNLSHLCADPERARDCLERALAADPRHADALYNLAQHHMETGSFAAACELWGRYLAIDGESAWAETARIQLKAARQGMLLARLSSAGGVTPPDA